MNGMRARARAAAVRVLGIDELPLDQPWDYVQALVERRLHEYLGVSVDEVRQIVIVGAWRGHEVGRMLPRYPACRFVCIEAHPQEYARLAENYRGEARVETVMAAAGRESHLAPFHVTDLAGTSSLLPPRPKETRFHTETVETLQVVPLDAMQLLGDEQIDCLWIDTQGSELDVLAGADRVLGRTRSVFAEVAVHEPAYEGGARMAQVADVLERRGFVLVALGTDPRNGEGNALWLAKQPA